MTGVSAATPSSRARGRAASFGGNTAWWRAVFTDRVTFARVGFWHERSITAAAYPQAARSHPVAIRRRERLARYGWGTGPAMTEFRPPSDGLAGTVQRWLGRPVLVVGDVMLDEWRFTEPHRLSREPAGHPEPVRGRSGGDEHSEAVRNDEPFA